MAHPNYAAVITELFAGPMLFGAWRTAAVFSLANLIVLAVRIRCEERALAAAEEARAQAGATAGAERAG
jgi:methyltransferase